MIRGKTTLQQCAPLAGEYQKVLFCNIEATEEETNNAGNIAAMCSAGREQLLREGIDQVCQGAAHWALGYCALQTRILRSVQLHTGILCIAQLHTGILAGTLRTAN